MIIFVINLVFATVLLNSISNSYRFFYIQSHEASITQLSMQKDFESAVENTIISMTSLDSNEVEESITLAQNDLASVKNYLIQFNGTYAGDPKLLEAFEKSINESVPFKEEIYKLSKQHRNEKAMKIYKESYSPLLEEAQSSLKLIGEDVAARCERNGKRQPACQYYI